MQNKEPIQSSITLDIGHHTKFIYTYTLELKQGIVFIINGQTLFLKPQSHRACDLAATLPQLKINNCREIAEVGARFYKGCNKLAARPVIGRRTKSVAASLFNMHKRLAATYFERRLVAKVFYKTVLSR